MKLKHVLCIAVAIIVVPVVLSSLAHLADKPQPQPQPTSKYSSADAWKNVPKQEKSPSEKAQEELETQALYRIYLQGMIKEQLNDPDSFQDRGAWNQPNGATCMSYTAKNVFNATIRGWAVMTPKSMFYPNSTEMWRKYCSEEGRRLPATNWHEAQQ